MKDSLSFRKINDIEKQIIISSVSNISAELPRSLENLKNYLYISIEGLNSKNKFPNIFFISKEHVKLIKDIDNENITSAGLYFGFIKKGNFYISLEGAEFLYENNLISDVKKVHVNDRGERSILYGNNILKNMITKSPSTLKTNDILIVLNNLNEIIALGRSVIDQEIIQNLKPFEVIAINLSDKGYYLRKKQ